MLRALLAILLSLTLSAPASAWTLKYLGQQILPSGYEYSGTIVGGLSGIEYDPVRHRFYVLSDDQSELNPARFYTFRLDLRKFNTLPDPGYGGITFTNVTYLQDRQGMPYAARQVDPESIRLSPDGGSLFWANEGNANAGIPPSIEEIGLNGEYRRTLPLPGPYLPRSNRGVRHNLAFESLAIDPAGKRLHVATENALLQDGPAANARQGSSCRVLAYELASGKPVAEYVYPADPVTHPPSVPLLFHTNGLVELLALDGQRFLALERSYTQFAGNGIRIYLADLEGATDVSLLDSLEGQSYRPMAKSLLLDLSSLGIPIDNIEGMTWGPALPNGNRSLILVSDNNFSSRQITQFLAFEVIP